MKNHIFILCLLVLSFLTFPSLAKEKNIYMEVEVLAYNYSNSRTAMGTIPQLGTIAVDPKVIPLGWKIYVPGYGWGKALDTGSAIKGKKIDIWFPTYKQCIKWGKKKLTITIVKK